MSNLIPEKRVNKNGVVVTKHVRASQPAPVTASFPSPNPGAGKPRPATPLFEESLALFQKEDTSGFSIDDLAPEALEKIEALLLADAQMKPTSYSVSNGIGTALLQSSLEERTRYFHNIAVFGPIVMARKDNNLSVSSFVTGLGQYSDDVLWPKVDYLIDAPEDLTQKAKNLLEFTIKANGREVVSDALVYDSFMDKWESGNEIDDVFMKIKEKEVALYVMDHPEHGDALLDMIEEAGGILPMELIKGRLNHDVQSLREGFL